MSEDYKELEVSYGDDMLVLFVAAGGDVPGSGVGAVAGRRPSSIFA